MKVITCDVCGTKTSDIWVEFKGKDLCSDCYKDLEVELTQTFNDFINASP